MGGIMGYAWAVYSEVSKGEVHSHGAYALPKPCNSPELATQA
jgi:hypothetical protein